MVVLIGVMSYKTFRNEPNVLQKFALYVKRKLILSFVIWNPQCFQPSPCSSTLIEYTVRTDL